MTFKLTNIRIEDNTMIAFYEFENNTSATNRFPYPTEVHEIEAWGTARAEWLTQRDKDLEEFRLLAMSNPEAINILVEEEVAKSMSLDELIATKVSERIALETAVDIKERK